jgi:hypothetical protein
MNSVLPRCAATVGAFVLAHVIAGEAKAEQLVNGGFELPELVENQNFVGAFSFLGWTGFSTGNGGNAGIVHGLDFGLMPFDGIQGFSFNGNNPPAGSFIEQAFPTVPGETYVVNFAVGRNNGFAAQFLQLDASVYGSGGDLLASIATSPPSDVGFLTTSFVFTANSVSSRLRFTDNSGSNPNTDLFLDGIRVAAVADSGNTVSLLGLSALVAFAIMQKRPPKSAPFR